MRGKRKGQPKKRTRSDLSSKGKRAVAIKKKRVAVPKTRNAGKWSEGEYFQRIRASLRRTFRFWTPMQEALRRASRPSQSSNKRLKTEFQCKKCSHWFPRKSVQIDHIEECGSLMKPEDIAPFLERLTKEDVNAYQVLCKNCHSIKTKEYLANKKKKL